MNKKTTRIIIFNLFKILLVAQFISCNDTQNNGDKETENKRALLSKSWKIDLYTVNDINYTSLIYNYVETFRSSGQYNYSWSIFEGSGVWHFQNKDTEIKLKGIDKQASRTLTILKLEEKRLWYYFQDSVGKHEFKLIKE